MAHETLIHETLRHETLKNDWKIAISTIKFLPAQDFIEFLTSHWIEHILDIMVRGPIKTQTGHVKTQILFGALHKVCQDAREEQ